MDAGEVSETVWIPPALRERGLTDLNLSPRCENALARGGFLTLGDLHDTAISDLGRPSNVGDACLTALLSAVRACGGRIYVVDAHSPLPVEVGDDESSESSMDQGADSSLLALGDLRVIAAWTKGVLDEEQLGAVLRPREVRWPTPIRAALERLLEADAATIAGDLLHRFHVRQLLSDFATKFSSNQQIVLRDRSLSLAPLTQSAIADRLGVSRQRVSQVEQTALEKLDSLLNSSTWAPIRWRAALLADALGAAAPLAERVLRQELRRLTACYGRTAGSEAIRIRDLLLYVAGPYRLDGGWLVSSKFEERLEALDESLRAHADKGGVVSADVVADLLGTHVRSPFHTRWVNERTQFVQDDRRGFVDRSGTLLDQSERALWRLGAPASWDEIQQEMGTDYDSRGARGRLGQSAAIMRVTKDKFGLRAWGHDEYTGVSDEIAQEIEACGGVASLRHLVEVLPARYEIAEASVRMCAGAPRFIGNAAGEIRLRLGTDPPFRSGTTLRGTPACYRNERGWAIRLEVDQDLLRGSGRACPAAFAEALGVYAADSATFASVGGEISVSWSAQSPSGPSFGSLRELAESLGAAVGDHLFIEDCAERLGAWLVREEDVNDAGGLAKALLLVGMQVSNEESAMSRLAVALDLPPSSSPHQVAGALRNRGEGHLADLVPRSENEHETVEEALREIRKLFE